MQFDQSWLEGPAFTWRKAYALASACKLAYAQPVEIQRMLRDRWRMGGRIFSRGDTQGFVAVGPKVIVASFRGTKGLGDWIGNIRLAPRAFPPAGGHAHVGFVHGWELVADIVSETIAEAPGRTVWFTGHSLGAAVALLGGTAEAARTTGGIVTFGQPRLLDADAAHNVAGIFGDRYTRIVNDTDIVARIPPFYRHTGRLHHFDFVGALRGISPFESLDADAGPPEDDGPDPVSETVLDDLRDQIESFETARSVLPEAEQDILPEDVGPTVEEDIDIAIEGILPGVEDHRIDAYVNLMRRQAFPPAQPDLGEAVSHLVEQDLGLGALRGATLEGDFGAPAAPGTAAGEPVRRQPVLLRLRRADWTPPDGMPVGSRMGTIVTARASAADLEALENDPNVAVIEASRQAGILDLSDSLPFVRADSVHRPPTGERGDAALVGIVDTGVDILHRAFLGADGKTRILAVWDQSGRTGPSPRDVDPAFESDYGRLYVKSEIDAFIAAHAAGSPTHPVRLRDRGEHGTHVAGIAAGRATGAQPDGMAPEAGIVVVMSSLSQAPGDPFSIGYSNAHVDALGFLRTVAEGRSSVSPLPRPIAINVSQGMNAGAHDGTTTLEAAFDMATGMGRDPGFVIVKSAGNERGQAGHALKKIFQGVEELRWLSGTRLRSSDYFEAWFDGLDDVAFSVIDPSGNRSDEVSIDNRNVSAVLGGNLCRLGMTGPGGHPDNGHHRLTIDIQASPQPIQPGQWTLELNGRSVVSELGEVHVWVERDRFRAVRFAVEDEEMTLSVPGTAQSVICVGACNSALPLRLNRSSSWGLTRDGRRKPELCAPGHQIVSCWSAQSDLEAVTAKTGTSMAAPHVTGALALALSAREKSGLPQWNAVQLRSALVRSVRGLPQRHHLGAGYGVLDTERLMQLLA
ncbi:S8 family serine peptidase [Tropicimonas sp. IMCC6043]|uniref:S8 family serine peptidase n=1 Tax=Tropicimonas sp. IMCC6043 TaxID=2510645 RepID=UPI00101C1363|nr:S8 family serine peptidase [Tropicimonas sp. IMCC6043]RYH09191.1 hypothetical protein EU800_13360 [Tropicimonas sp. IMCC6043]